MRELQTREYLVMTRSNDGLIQELVEIERQIKELKSAQFNGSSNNYSGEAVTSNTYVYTPSTNWNTIKGWRVRVISPDISLNIISIYATDYNTGQRFLPLKWEASFTWRTPFNVMLDGNYESWYEFWDYDMDYPKLNVEATAISNTPCSVIIEGMEQSFA